MSMTPLIQPTNTNATFYEGTVKTTISAQDLQNAIHSNQGGPWLSIYLALPTSRMPISYLNNDAGASMYLFDATNPGSAYAFIGQT